jgi:ribosomal protein L40E
MLLFWPVIIPQIWGLIQQAHLDDEAVNLVEQRLAACGAPATGAAATPPAQAPHFCVACGAANPADASFCPHCGAKVA